MKAKPRYDEKKIERYKAKQRKVSKEVSFAARKRRGAARAQAEYLAEQEHIALLEKKVESDEQKT